MQTIKQIQDEIVEDFSSIEDWTDKYVYLIELGNELPPLDEKHRNEQNLLKGCQSRLWVHAEKKEGRIYYYADSDALIVKGIIALLLKIYSEKTPQEILNADKIFVHKIGLDKHLSPMRSNGLFIMIEKIRFYAASLRNK